MAKKVKPAASRPKLPKALTGIVGLDEITGGGLPKGRPTLVCGGAGCGKTLLSMEFIVRGATQFNEPGVFMAFEETGKDLTQNVASLGFDLNDLVAHKKIVLDVVNLGGGEMTESGGYDLEGLFIRMEAAIDSIGATRVVLDSIESLFAGLSDLGILRAELTRLFLWLKDKGVTAIITGERGDKTLTRHGLEEYVSDCVIVLDHRIEEQVSSRRLLVVKYRGSTHGTNEYPFLIDEDGISVLPITSVGLQHVSSSVQIPSGIDRLDTMLDGGGYFLGSTILVTGTAGTGKTSVAAKLVDATCRRGERAMYFSFEESPSQVIRNMRSIGMDLESWVKQGLLQFEASRPTIMGLEAHMTIMHRLITRFRPQVVVLDQVNSFVSGGNQAGVKQMLMRLMDFLKSAQITALFTSLTSDDKGLVEQTEIGISSLIDTWISLRCIEMGGERNRGLYVLKSRGMSHSNQIREFLFTDEGAELLDVYVGRDGLLTGSARMAQEAKRKAALALRGQKVQLRETDLERKRSILNAQIAVLKAEFEAVERAALLSDADEAMEEVILLQDRVDMGLNRGADLTIKERNSK